MFFYDKRNREGKNIERGLFSIKLEGDVIFRI